jgi:hypothetical protein
MILKKDPGRLQLSQGASLKPDESEGCSPVSGGRSLRRACSGGRDCRLWRICWLGGPQVEGNRI